MVILPKKSVQWLLYLGLALIVLLAALVIATYAAERSSKEVGPISVVSPSKYEAISVTKDSPKLEILDADYINYIPKSEVPAQLR